MKLSEIADLVSARFNISKDDVVDTLLNASVDNDINGVTKRESDGSPSLKRRRSEPQQPRALKDVVGQNIDNLDVSQLRELLSTVPEHEQAVPFLLRFVLGEFKYGQRATKLKKNQKAQKPITPVDSPRNKSIKRADSAGDNHQNKVSEAFDVLARESAFCHLHQLAGWVDIKDVSVWDNYVKDVMFGKLRDNDTLFEAGCGVLAFLRSAQKLASNVAIGGLDGAAKTIELIKKDYVSKETANNFFVGFLPEAMNKVESNSWDIVVCNSVFQYFSDRDQAVLAVKEMLRVAKRWVIIADVVDEKYALETKEHKERLQSASDQLPDYLTYPRGWWEQFDSIENLVSIKKVESQTYVRRKERYTVYIEKNAPIIQLG